MYPRCYIACAMLARRIRKKLSVTLCLLYACIDVDEGETTVSFLNYCTTKSYRYNGVKLRVNIPE